MNIKGQGHSTLLSFFSIETARLAEAKFHVESPWDRE